MDISNVKITVLKRFSKEQVFDGKPPAGSEDVISQCDAVEDGQSWVSESIALPEGFCPWAFADIQRDIAHLALGGDYPWVGDSGKMYSACTDGFRPVVFKLERI